MSITTPASPGFVSQGTQPPRVRRVTVQGWLLLAILAAAPSARAQWLNQSVNLKAGWNAVFLHVDASYRTLNASVGNDPANPIQEIWRWNPPPLAQFTTDPASPATAADWSPWVRTNSASALQRLTGDAAYLVRVDPTIASYTWDIKGRPVPPRHDWSVSGLNLVGFPTVAGTPPTFASFFTNSTELQSAPPEVYRYVGGDLGPSNPVRLASPLFPTENVERGQAYWIRSGTTFSRYFGPFEVITSDARGIDFGESQGSTTIRLRNLTAAPLNVRLVLQASAAAPANQPAVAGEPPLLIRGALDPLTYTYGYTNLPISSARVWNLAPRQQPGAETEIVLGLNRSAITQPPGTLLAGILRFTDASGHTMIHVPVSATVASSAGLWVGDATVTQVAHALRTYQRDAAQQPVTGTNGNYVVTGTDTSLGPVSQPYALRLIVHNPTNSLGASLLQRVYFGLDQATNPVASRGESALHPSFLGQARRISAAHLPWSASNVTWTFNGKLGQPATLTTTVEVAFDDQASNPFLHTYHPDHDNRSATFDTMLPQGQESYRVERQITLGVQPPADHFASLVNAGSTLGGDYTEIMTFKGLARSGGSNDTRQIQVRGTFQLQRILDLPALTLAP
ncbi:MAG: hypothetical protein IT581_08075 [Verrucomicrobiales bacterium]|nr:hypothetical protein [Verrucomicrobiales bacterium]